MAWKDNLRPASFRGVAFKVESHDTTGGRRAVTHEFPLRDKPFVEDMGRRAKSFSVKAYIVGDNYMAQRDSLMRACDEAGASDLMHPYLGTLRVVCTGWTLSEGATEGRLARFTLSFAESGEAEFPTDSADPVSLANIAADAAKQFGIADFASKFSIDGLADFGVEDAQSLLNDAAEGIAGIARTVTSATGGSHGFLASVSLFSNSLVSLMASPSVLADNVFRLFEDVTSIFSDDRSALRGISSMRGFGSDVVPFPVTTSTRQRQQDNRTAIIGLVNQATLIQSSRIAPGATYETVQDAQFVRDDLANGLDDVMEDPATADDVYSSFQDLRTVVVKGVPPDALSLPNLVTFTPKVTMPSLVLAYDLYEDANRADAIVTRNDLPYSGFVPAAEPLLVLSNA